jgi:hypothetical protein
MARFAALARTARHQPLDVLRAAIVCGCALALIVAERALPIP